MAQSFSQELGAEDIAFKADVHRETAKAFMLFIKDFSENSANSIRDTFPNVSPAERDEMEDTFAMLGALKEKAVWLPKSKTAQVGRNEGDAVFTAPIWLLKAKAEETGDF